jgi:hypothetical protein
MTEPSTIQKDNALKFLRLLTRSGLDPMTNWNAAKLKSDGYMDLAIDRLGRHPVNNGVMFALAHNGVQNGDLMADPDMGMTYFVRKENSPAYLVATHYQNDYAGFYQATDQYDDNPAKQAHVQREMDDFLSMWLNNLLEQGHTLSGGKDES